MKLTVISRLAALQLLLNLLGVIVSVNAMSLPVSSSSSAASAASSGTIRWGIIGLGDVVKHKTGPAFLQAEGSDLVAVCSRTPGKAATWAAANGGPNCQGYDRLEEFLKDDRIDAYYIATPPGQHVYMAMKVAAAAADRSAAIYIEKPVGRSYEETATISASLQARGIPLYTAYTSRAYPRTMALKDLLESGRIGQVTNITYRLTGANMVRGLGQSESLPWRLQADVSGGGLFLDVGCHLLDRLNFVAGPLVDVRGQGLNRQSPGQDVEDYVWLKSKIGGDNRHLADDGATNFCIDADVDCIWDFTPPTDSESENQDELVFQGTKGSLRMKGMSPDAPVRVLHQDGSLAEELVFDPVPLAGLPLIQMVTDDLLGKGSCESKGDNARRTSAIMDTVLKGYYGGRGDDFFHRPESWPGIPPARRELYLAEL